MLGLLIQIPGNDLDNILHDSFLSKSNKGRELPPAPHEMPYL